MATLRENLSALFGFKIVEPQKQNDPEPVSFTNEIKDDGAVVVAAGGSYGTYIDLESTVRTESELVTRYREMSLHAEVEKAINNILNQAVVLDDDYVVRLDMDKLEQSENIKNRIDAEFQEILQLLNFENDAYELMKRWYIDGRMYYHVIIDEKNPQNGILELRYIDPRKIRKVREVQQEQGPNGVILTKNVEEYFVYNDRGFPSGTSNTLFTGAPQTGSAGIKISTDSIIQITSGLMDQNNQMVLSYLHKAIKSLNMLKSLEDATVIYRISRAPERRVFYIDVGNLPKQKAEQYVNSLMTKFKNKLVYDAATGEIRDDRKYMAMLEDFWLPRREGGKGTEISTLDGGQNLGEMTDVNYFLKKLMEALEVPVSRLEPDKGFSLGRSSEITRDEVDFAKFVNRLRRRFSQLFQKAMERQVVLKGVCTKEEWQDFQRHIRHEYMEDNHFAELKDSEILQARIALAESIQPFVGKYYSHEFVRKTVLRQSAEEIESEDELIGVEKSNPQFAEPIMMPGDMMPGMDGGPGGMVDDGPGSGFPGADDMEDKPNFFDDGPDYKDEKGGVNPIMKKLGDKPNKKNSK
jgi:hypothetical protein